MGFLDMLKKSATDTLKRTANNAIRQTTNQAVKSANNAVKNAFNSSEKSDKSEKSGKSEKFLFATLPGNLSEMTALPEASLDTPFKAAALTVCALCVFAEDKEKGIEMLNWLKGPQPLTPSEIQFISDRFMDGKSYIPGSYFEGAVPDNDYTVTLPAKIVISDNPYSYQDENYATLYITSGGADSPRQVKLRRKGEQWFLWEQFLLSDIRIPKSADPWA